MYVFIILALVTGVRGVCNGHMQQGPYKFKEFVPRPGVVSRFQLSAEKISIAQEEAQFLIGYRSFWRSYCYQGGPLDSNTGCYNNLNNEPPTIEELKKWSELSKCETGPDVIDGWGSDSVKCVEVSKEGKWYNRKELEKKVNNNHFAHHTCTLTWRCGISHSNTRLNLRFTGDSNSDLSQTNDFEMVLVMPNGSTVPVSREETFWVEGEFGYLIRHTHNINIEKISIDCFYDNSSHELDYICREIDTYALFPLIGNVYCQGATCYRWKNLPYSTHKEGYFKNLHEGKAQARAPSIADLTRLINVQSYELEGLRYNFAELDSRFNKLSKLFDTLVNSLAKIDDSLIGKLMGQSFQSKYLSEEYFLLYPCSHPKAVTSNCVNNSIFEDGRWIVNNDFTKCVQLGNYKEIDLFMYGQLWIPSILMPKVEGIISDQEGWSFVAENKKALIDTMLYTKNGGTGTSLEDVVNYPKGWINGQIGGLFTGTVISYVVIFIIILVVIYVLKKIF